MYPHPPQQLKKKKKRKRNNHHVSEPPLTDCHKIPAGSKQMGQDKRKDYIPSFFLGGTGV
jgi:hypothetical protein